MVRARTFKIFLSRQKSPEYPQFERVAKFPSVVLDIASAEASAHKRLCMHNQKTDVTRGSPGFLCLCHSELGDHCFPGHVPTAEHVS